LNNAPDSIRAAARRLDERTTSILSVFGVLSGVALIMMMLLTVADAIGRRLPSPHPIYGSYEGVNFLLCLVFFFALCYCTARKGHFTIDVATKRFPPRAHQITVIIMYLISVLICWLLAAELVVLAITLKDTGITGIDLKFLPTYPFPLLGAICVALMGWGFLVQFLNLLLKTTGSDK
jgi:TRAP-type C4-dicarboxylate transport system permease small subunit